MSLLVCAITAAHSLAGLAIDEEQTGDSKVLQVAVTPENAESPVAIAPEPALDNLALQSHEVMVRSGLVEPLEWYAPGCSGGCNTNEDCEDGCKCQAVANQGVGTCK